MAPRPTKTPEFYEAAYKAARKLLTHRKRRPDEPHADVDTWRLARAQWHWDFGSRTYAKSELKDINEFRASRDWDNPGKYPPLELRR